MRPVPAHDTSTKEMTEHNKNVMTSLTKCFPSDYHGHHHHDHHHCQMLSLFYHQNFIIPTFVENYDYGNDENDATKIIMIIFMSIMINYHHINTVLLESMHLPPVIQIRKIGLRREHA